MYSGVVVSVPGWMMPSMVTSVLRKLSKTILGVLALRNALVVVFSSRVWVAWG